MSRTAVYAALVSLALTACASSPSVSTDTTAGVNFGAYSSFAWANALPPSGMNPVAFERIRQDVNTAMTSKGFTPGAEGDMTLILTVGAKDKTDVSTWGRWGQRVDVYQYTEGKMSIDVFDTKTKQPLWHGQATQTIDPNKSDPTLIDAAVTGVMAKFPARG